MQKIDKKYVLAALIIIALVISTYLAFGVQKQDPLQNNAQSEASADEETGSHVDYTLSNAALEKHLHGKNVPCKSEFPASWDAAKLQATLTSLAQDASLNWEKADNGYYVAEKNIEGLEVRVVVDREDDVVVTGYPVNVERNACPKRDNSEDAEQPQGQPPQVPAQEEAAP
jgi:hypothetical protein